jgi:threonine dehydrogenase-like Zn-dependent dehydrogenase
LGDTVVIQGAGPVGLAALALARQAGASKIIVVGAPDHRLKLAREFGADETVSIEAIPLVEDRRKLIVELAGGYGADYVAECVGYPAAVPEGLELCRDGGTFLVLGQYANAGDVTINPHIITRKQLRLAGSWGFEPRHVHQALRFLDGTNWKHLFAKQVTHTFRLDQANEALDTVRHHRSGKAVIVP